MKKVLLREADPAKAAEYFFDLVVGAQMMTAVILGQVSPSRPNLADTRHAVEWALRKFSFFSLVALASVVGCFRKRRRANWLFVVLICILPLGVIGGCGGGSGSSPTPPPTTATYTVNITGTSGSLSHSVPLSLTVTN